MSSRMKVVGAAAVAFFGVVLVARATGVAGVVWNAETTNEWFTATMDLQSPWDAPDNGEARVDDGTIKFDTEVSDPLKYDPADSGPVALVNVRMVVDPNASTPSTTGLEAAQAALSVVTNASGYLEWVGLTKTNNSVLAWVPLSGDNPTVGATYDVQIAVDNHASKRIRYAVKSENAATYTILTCSGVPDGDGWLPNPQPAKSSVAKVAFAGAGTIKSLNGNNIVEVGPSVRVDPFVNSAAYDFTNGTITAVVSIPSGDYSDKTAVLRVTKLSDSTYVDYVKDLSNAEPFTVNLGSLAAGEMFSYSLSVKYGDEERTVKSGTFVSANWPQDCLFGAKFVSSSPVVTNGTWQGADVGSEKWDIVTNAQFAVDSAARTAAAGGVTRVDTSYSFETFIDTDSLEPLSGAVGGIVAVSDGADPAWYAYTGTSPNVSGGWQKLNGDIAPATNTEYVVRAEFDFKSATHSVSYFVSSDGATTFSPLTLDNGDITVGLTGNATSLSSVGMSGKGYVKSICAKLANGAVAEDSEGRKFATLWDALRSGSGDIKLNTNATLVPSGVTGGKFKFRKGNGSYDVIFDDSALQGTWKLVEKDGVWYLMKPAATYIFF